MRAPDGSFYGTTGNGGADAGDGFGYGTVYRLSAMGKVVTLHAFKNVAGGRHPSDRALSLGIDGFLYGTCYQGGSHPDWHLEGGMGTVYKIAPWYGRQAPSRH